MIVRLHKIRFSVYFYSLTCDVAMVTAPPQIISEWSSDDVVVVEGKSIALTCNVTGEPHPEVTWYRRPLSSSSWPADAESK